MTNKKRAIMSSQQNRNQNNNSQSAKPIGIGSSANQTAGSEVKNSSPTGLVSLPKGGASVKGIGEKFQANPVTGTASFTVPIALSAGRDNFTPQLALSYNSGSGNSPFGLGWNVGLPSISRKTDKGLPRYADSEDSDTFILAGAEDLVPRTQLSGSVWVDVVRTEGDYTVREYRPRVEGLFSRIERYQHNTTKIIHWKATTRDNITTLYGTTAQSRIANPLNDKQIFEWLPQQTYDAKGNLMQFVYKSEDNTNIIAALHEHSRIHSANRYLKQVQYGNTQMFTPGETYNGTFLFRLVLDYGEHSANTQAETQAWTGRADSFSNYRAGFEIRTHRLCQRLLMFHNFGTDTGGEILVKSTELTHLQGADFTVLQSVQHRFYDGSNSETLPPVSFTYSSAQVGTVQHQIEPKYLDNMPAGLEGHGYSWVDLYGEGISGLLKQDTNAFHYKPNLGDARYFDNAPATSQTKPQPMLGNMRTVMQKPNTGASFQLTDLDGNGQLDLVIDTPAMSGYYALSENGTWENFRTFLQRPNINRNDPNLRMIDVNGDGHADILITEHNCFTCYYSKTTQGFEPPVRFAKPGNESDGPAVLFADYTQTIFLADMTGDGLTDIVRIRHASVCYWPNMGYGRFGKQIIMNNPPRLDSPDIFHPRRIRLADVDGSGTTDIIYMNGTKTRCWKNQSGNRWSDPVELNCFPASTDMDNLSVVDLMGNGTSCLVWSSPMPSGQRQVRYVELTNGIKPHLLTQIDNNMGAITRLQYAPSTKFYLRDKQQGKPWITRLPFPVQVLERVETLDQITQSRFVSLYGYHHGYFDGVEREFRGFGMVEQWDSEQYANANNTLFDVVGANIDETSFVPPVYTKTWFHTGFYRNRADISNHYKTEYFGGDSQAWLLPDTLLPEGLSPAEAREACRALKGSVLRHEVYALDGTTSQNIPYTVEEKSYRLTKVQPLNPKAHAVFLVTADQGIAYQYERNAADPRILHTLTLETNAWGNPLKSAQVAYPRRTCTEILPEQQQLHVVVTQNQYINQSNILQHRIGVVCQTQQFELTGIALQSPFTVQGLNDAFGQATAIDYATAPTTGIQKRCFAHSRTYFYNSACTDKLPLGQIAAHGLVYNGAQADITATLLTQLQQTRPEITATVLTTEGKYIAEDSKYWIPTEVAVFEPTAFYLPTQIVDPFGNSTTLQYDDYKLFATTVTNALGHVTTAQYDYRVLQPETITDPNGNHQRAQYNTLGLLAAQAATGKNGEGDTLQNPTTQYQYNFDNFRNNQLPVYVHVKQRTQHATENFMESYVYSNGTGNAVMTKTQAEPHPDTPQTPRWIGTGRTVLNNKGNVVKQYEPYFSPNHHFETEAALVENGVTPIFHYDPLGRNIKTNFPDGTLAKVEFTPWQQKSYDQNDTILESQWYTAAQAGSTAQQRAAQISAPHANTPQVVDFDTLGRPFQTTDDNAAEGKYTVHQTLDIAGRAIVITDAKNRAMTTHTMGLANLLKTTNIDSGTRWQLTDVAGKPLYMWDSRNHQIKHTYDQLQRPTLVTLSALSALVVEKTVYGIDPTKNNIGQAQFHYDQSGKTEIESYDFKGNPLKTIKQFCEEYSTTIDWNAAPTLQTETFETEFTYDALNRPVTQSLPDTSTQTNTYNQAGLLETVAKDTVLYVTNINYNEKGQRTDIYYGNGSKTKYEYDTQTFRLKRLLTTRNNGIDILQDISYIYDPVGNIVEMNDLAQQTHYFSNSVIEPKGQYEYDALYRLTKATGRELTSLQLPTHTDFANNIAMPNTASNAMQNYIQTYQYDELGNILQMKSGSQWTRNYFYNTNDNKLLGHTENTTEYTYDAHGNILTMPHLQSLVWDFRDELKEVILNASGDKAYYIYDATGNRTRKVVVKGNIVEERNYLGNYEVFRKTTNGTLDFERKTIHISDDKKKIATVETKTGETEVVRYQYDNHLGSASLELDENAAIISYEEYHPFGTTSYRSGRSETEVSLKRYKYVGKERDEETGLYYYGARYYAVWLGRFVSVDPMKAERTWVTPYNYVQNNPINRTDPTGALDEDPPKEGGIEGFNFVQIKKAEVTMAGKSREYWKIDGLADTKNQDYQDLISKIKEMKENSPSFKKLLNSLENKSVNITIASDAIEGLGAGAAQSPGLNQGGLIVFKKISDYSPNTCNSAEFVIAEEFFHQFQNIEYGITMENTINQTSSRTVTEIEAEAKVFDKLVLDELGIDISNSPLPTYLSDVFYEWNNVGLISKNENKKIEGNLKNDYNSYFTSFKDKIEQTSNLNSGKHVYKSNNTSNQFIKTPNAFNKLVK
jgi:RHS repeat-associated protein